jgi:hypothetical protein
VRCTHRVQGCHSSKPFLVQRSCRFCTCEPLDDLLSQLRMHPYHSELQVMRALLSARCQDQHYLQWPLCLASCYHQGVAAKLSLAACLDLALLPQALQLGIHIASSLHFSLHCWSETNIQRVTVYSLHCKPRYRFVTNCIASNKLKSFKHRQCQASTVVLQQRRLLCRPGLCGRQCN